MLMTRPILIFMTLLFLPLVASAQARIDGYAVLAPAIKALPAPEMNDKTQGSISEDTQAIAYAYYQRAYDHSKVSHLDLALRDLNQAIALAPDFQEAHLAMGIIYISRSRYDRALPDLSRILALDPKNEEALYLRAYVYYQTHNADGVIQDASEAIALNSGDQYLYGLYVLRGVANFMRKNDSAAISDMTHTISLSPTQGGPSVYEVRAAAYIHRGDYRRAIVDCTQAVGLDPKNASGYELRAAAYTKQSDYGRAIADCTRAIAIDPNDAGTYEIRSHAYAEKGNKAAAAVDTSKAKILRSLQQP